MPCRRPAALAQLRRIRPQGRRGIGRTDRYVSLRRRTPTGAKPANGLVTPQHRHVTVDEHQVERFDRAECESGGSVLHDSDRTRERLEDDPAPLAMNGMIVSDEDSRLRLDEVWASRVRALTR
jgi:hypothetical protein